MDRWIDAMWSDVEGRILDVGSKVLCKAAAFLIWNLGLG